ncbi:MAG: 3-methyl-2-oxobutanoate hydroxymethyltransferase [Puniceicoccaceae bacterium]|nr:3-methyl-2-oxobutanoate hydroxymethyltransferase [Puniceicoccaceae bacterium]
MSKTIQSIRALKGKRAIVATTAYDAIIAKLADRSGMDILLVGDSVGTTQLGFQSTVEVTLEMMLHHTAAVVRANTEALVVADLPFAYSHDAYEHLFSACRQLIQAGAAAVKIEGGQSIVSSVERLTASGIPVMGHIGLLPQQIKNLGHYRRFGKTEAEAKELMADAKALEAAGCFAMIGEMVNPEVSRSIAEQLEIPYIGIGSGSDCDGQILVANDLLGFSVESVPSFVHQFGNLSEQASQAFEAYVHAVKEGDYPNE